MVVGEGFEPSKSVTADLQSAPFGRLGIPPKIKLSVRSAVALGKAIFQLWKRMRAMVHF